MRLSAAAAQPMLLSISYSLRSHDLCAWCVLGGGVGGVVVVAAAAAAAVGPVTSRHHRVGVATAVAVAAALIAASTWPMMSPEISLSSV